MNTTRMVGVLTTLFGIIGFFASFSLVLERLASYENPDHVAKCDINPLFSCTTITQTWQASLFGFPNPLIGVVAFTVAITLGVLMIANVALPRWIHLGFLSGITLGMAFILWLFTQSVFSIGLLCLYCMAVWVATVILFFTVLKTNLDGGHLGKKMDPVTRERISGWCWVGATIVLIVMASILAFTLFL